MKMISFILALLWVVYPVDAISAPGLACNFDRDNPVSKLIEFVCPDQKVSENFFQEALDRSLLPYLKKTEREVSFYHYGSRDKYKVLPSKDGSYTGPVDINEKDANGEDIGKNYLKTVSYMALHSEKQTSELGTGIYTATEPLASISYSDQKGFLMKVTVPSGMGYLDLRIDHRTLPVSRDDATTMYCYAIQQGSSAGFLSKLVSDPPALDITRMIKSPITQKFVQRFYNQHDVGFLAAGYGEYNYKECHLDSKQSFMTMAVFQNPNVIDRIKTELFVPKLEKTPSQEKKKAYQDLLEYFDAFDCDQTEKREVVNSLCDPQRDSFKKFAEYRQAISSVIGKTKITPKNREKLTRSLFGCNPKYPGEVTSVNRNHQ